MKSFLPTLELAIVSCKRAVICKEDNPLYPIKFTPRIMCYIFSLKELGLKLLLNPETIKSPYKDLNMHSMSLLAHRYRGGEGKVDI